MASSSPSAPLSWDLRSPSSPRSLCVFRAPPDSTNPFESAIETAVVFGTERGSLHYRCYPDGNDGDGLLQPLETSRSTQPINQINVVSGSIVTILYLGPSVFFMLIDDNRGSSASEPGVYASQLITLRGNSFHPLPIKTPRMSCATISALTDLGLVYASGRQIANLTHESFVSSEMMTKSFNLATALPLPGVRSGPDALEVTCDAQVVVASVGSTFYAVSIASGVSTKILSFHNSSLVHPILIRDFGDRSTDWSGLLFCSGRDCAVMDLWKPPEEGTVTAIQRHSIQTQSPILNIASLWPWLVLLTSDGLISMRSPSCLAIPLRTMEVGARPNDFFLLEKIPPDHTMLASLSYGGECTLIKCSPDNKQDLADRLMRLSIDAFGTNGFPRSEVAETLSASFTATSYVGPEANASARSLLKQYLEAILGLADFVSGSTSSWPGGEGTSTICATALLCLVCTHDTPDAALANRATKESCGSVTFAESLEPSVRVCEQVAERMLREATQSIDLLKASKAIASTNKANLPLEFTEAAIWLMRACGRHERAFEILEQKLRIEGWSKIKYESYAATHLSDLWTHPDGRDLVLELDATKQLLESNPGLGLSVFTASHPRNSQQWQKMIGPENPLNSQPSEVIKLLKSIKPLVRENESPTTGENAPLSLDTGRALAIAFLESAIGINTGRPTQEDFVDSLLPDEAMNNLTESLHDELSYLLLEGIIGERGDNDGGEDSSRGKIYRSKLRQFLRWPMAKVNAERLLASLPSSFLEEQALLLGRLGRHHDALRILYVECKSLDLALAYCDSRHQHQKVDEGCAYLPLIRVALDSDPDPTQSSAIQVLAMRSSSIDRAAALRLLPKSIPVSAVARPFLIPALVDSESEIRRLTLAAALLRAKYLSLKQKLTNAQIKAQSTLQGTPQLRAMNLGEPLHLTKAIKIRPSHSASSTFPEVTIVKYFFPRHLIIQANITNSATSIEGRALGDITFVVADSSEEAIQPSMNVALKALPFQATGCSWCVLSANPKRMDSIAILSCELRYVVSSVEFGSAMTFGGAVSGRTYVEELQDIEVHAAHFT
mmetsp:Transcript_26227/g.38770  ORF Transcript_26227/g.38770 Transcript_26227/m.38770 type:complete len:1068 (-) Transcript_26227:20-3223(-)|eukprot:CAMPEP_0194205046 /NCGR_PEP_ID=MMETSP0156-20130528/4402_1 /TAXON_ID=33649 /ORGANISM="Thalassionema nitzschioides, Strain L26-B" /LENGTH=1067 /DNA_ID=CAMNT_0038931205 /DNA_START=198 /DNA_END=3401 /DNA_ORIENTATION=-